VTRYGWVALLALMGSVVAGVLAAAHGTLRRANNELETKAADLHEIATRQRAILNSAMDAIVTLNPEGAVETINRAGERMFGYPAEQLIQHDVALLLDLGPGEDRPVLERLDVSPDAVAGGLVKELTARRADGARFPADLALGAMELPDGLHLVAMIRDISDRKRAEQLKDEFVSTVSHELRTPLTSIAGSLGLLSGGAAGALPPQAERLTEIAHANCERLIRLINDILDIQKIESGNLRFDMAPVSLGQLVSRSVEDLRSYGDDLGVKMTLDLRSDPVVLADSDRMIQVITNLLSNAIKFSPAGETVELVLERKGRNGRLSIRDRGPGVPEAFRDQIFSKFAQADSTDTRQKGGTGLGLAISKEIVERHGGKISFESWTGRGATFHVDLPVLAAGIQRSPISRKGPPMGEVA
jgi:PAS domain S-box-containing protein